MLYQREGSHERGFSNTLLNDKKCLIMLTLISFYLHLPI